ncbi:MAG: ABC transporter ATP-binding protein, partial [Sphingomicrobium sp.]
ATSPKVMLLDEPFSNLDPYWVKRLCQIIRAELQQVDRCSVVSIHDLALAREFDRLIALYDGSIAFDGSPDKFLNSSDFEKVFRIKRSEVSSLR